MDKLIIKGGSKISGSIDVHGAKNSLLHMLSRSNAHFKHRRSWQDDGKESA